MKPLTVPALPTLPTLPDGGWLSVPGTRCGVAAAAVKPNTTRDDVVVLVAPGAIAAGVTTRSTAAAAPCLWTRSRLPGPVHAIAINAGNANAATGAQGVADTLASANAVAEVLGCSAEQVMVCSTGVIGVPMPMERVLPGLKAAASSLSNGGDEAAGQRAARAILTTDTRTKQLAVRVDGVTVGGMAKGSGMIHPGMATMLAFVATDAQVEAAPLQALVERLCERSFNAISVDGDMSTNDTLIVQATGAGRRVAPGDSGWEALEQGLAAVFTELARSIAADGEGATTLLEVVVQGLASDAEAQAAARAVVVSPLVKSAVHGRDPNWGRVVGALGAAGVPDLDKLDLDLGGVPVLRDGQPIPWDETLASEGMQPPVAQIVARLPGQGLGRAWGCDLSAGYVSINADYRS